jgi:hypothetical protein
MDAMESSYELQKLTSIAVEIYWTASEKRTHPTYGLCVSVHLFQRLG